MTLSLKFGQDSDGDVDHEDDQDEDDKHESFNIDTMLRSWNVNILVAHFWPQSIFIHSPVCQI